MSEGVSAGGKPLRVDEGPGEEAGNARFRTSGNEWVLKCC